MRALLAIVAIGWMSSGLAQGSLAAMEIDRADLIVRCTEYGVWIEGDLDEDVTATVDWEIFLAPLLPGDPNLMISGTREVIGDVDDRFSFRVIETTAEKICGSYSIKAHAEINGINRVDMELVEPAGGVLECFCATIGDFVWLDTNQNGVQDAGEPGLEGVEVRLRGFDDDSAIESIDITDADGLYGFEDLCAGDYRIDVYDDSLPAGLMPTTPDVGDDTLDSDGPLDGGFVHVVLADSPENDDLTIDFGFVEEGMLCEGMIGDFVWRDLDEDGVQDRNDPGIEGVVVELFDAAGGLLDSRASNGMGLYVFSGLCAGDYSVAYRADTVPPGFNPTLIDVGDDTNDSDPSPQAVTLGSDSAVDLSNDFGFVMEPVDCTGLIGDFIWEDLDQDGIQEAGEPGLEGVGLELRDSTGALLETTESATDGSYFFGGLCAGNYSVEWDTTTLPPGFRETERNVGDDTLDSDESPKAVQLPSDDAVDVTNDFGFFEQPVGFELGS